MQIGFQRVVLVWSENDLTEWREGDYAVTLTAEAYVAAGRLNSSRVLDARICIGDPNSVDESATELLNRLHETLKFAKFPWFEAYANVIFGTKAFQLVTWLTLIRSLQKKFLPLKIEVVPPGVFSDQWWSDNMFIYGLARRSFYVARKVLEREGVVFTSGSLHARTGRLRSHPAVRRGVAQVAALGLNLFSSGLRAGKLAGVTHNPKGRVDVLLAGQQFGDAFHSAPLAERLAAKFGERFLWIGMRPTAAPNMTIEETELISGLNFTELRFVDSASLARRHVSQIESSLLDLGSAWRISKMLPTSQELGIQRDEWFEFLDDPELRGFALRYEIWEEILRVVQPRVIVGLSALQDMAFIRAWARRNEGPFVCLMHGAFYSLKYSYDVDADYIGVFGQALADQLKKSNLPKPRQVAPCGAMQFGAKAKLSVRERTKHTNTPADSVLFLGFFDSLPFCPWSPADMWRMLRDIHEVCHEQGKTLRVRPHPRFPASFWSPFVEKLQDQKPGTIYLSSNPSLGADFMTTDFVVASGFEGAVLDALFAGKIVASYLPEGVEHIDHSKPLARMGGMARTLSQLRTLFSDIISGSVRGVELRNAQKRFFNNYVENPDGDPWDGALLLIDEALRAKDSGAISARA